MKGAPGKRDQCAEQRITAQQVRKTIWVTLFGSVTIPVQGKEREKKKKSLFYFKYKKGICHKSGFVSV